MVSILNELYSPTLLVSQARPSYENRNVWLARLPPPQTKINKNEDALTALLLMSKLVLNHLLQCMKTNINSA